MVRAFLLLLSVFFSPRLFSSSRLFLYLSPNLPIFLSLSLSLSSHWSISQGLLVGILCLYIFCYAADELDQLAALNNDFEVSA